MTRSICFTILIFFYTSSAISGLDRVFDIIGSDKNIDNPVWIQDNVIIIASSTLVFGWFFKNVTIAELNTGSGFYSYPNQSLLSSIIASPGTDDSSLTLNNVNHNYSGVYEAHEDLNIYSLLLTVHEVNMMSIDFGLTNNSGSCSAHLYIHDSILPLNHSRFNRTIINSSTLVFLPSDPSNNTSFEINNSDLNVKDNFTNTNISIQYSFVHNNFSIVKDEMVYLDASLIERPNITTDGTPDNCTISIQHNTKVTCVRNVTYCLNTNDTKSECNASSNLDNLILKYIGNATFVNLSIVYDIIYAKYHFDSGFRQCEATVTTTRPPDDADLLVEGLPIWAIVLIAVGAFIVGMLLTGAICCCLWKKRLTKTSKSEIRLDILPSTPKTISVSPEHTDRQQRRIQASVSNETIRPTIPEPTSKSYDRSKRPETRLKQQQQSHPIEYEQDPLSSISQSVSLLSDPIHQQQIPYGPRRPLISNV